jgi:hypothetical protein
VVSSQPVAAAPVPRAERRNFECTLCDYVAHHESDLRKHVAGKHLNLREYYCDSCIYSCMKSSDLLKHGKRKHGWYVPIALLMPFL